MRFHVLHCEGFHAGREFGGVIAVNGPDCAEGQILVHIVQVGMESGQYAPVLVDDAPDWAVQLHENLVALLHRDIPLLGQPQHSPELLPGFPSRNLRSDFHAVDGLIVDASQPRKLMLGDTQFLSAIYDGGDSGLQTGRFGHWVQLLSATWAKAHLFSALRWSPGLLQRDRPAHGQESPPRWYVLLWSARPSAAGAGNPAFLLLLPAFSTLPSVTLSETVKVDSFHKFIFLNVQRRHRRLHPIQEIGLVGSPSADCLESGVVSILGGLFCQLSQLGVHISFHPIQWCQRRDNLLFVQNKFLLALATGGWYNHLMRARWCVQ